MLPSTRAYRIRYRKVDAETGDEIDSSDIIKGYEVGKGQYERCHCGLACRSIPVGRPTVMVVTDRSEDRTHNSANNNAVDLHSAICALRTGSAKLSRMIFPAANGCASCSMPRKFPSRRSSSTYSLLIDGPGIVFALGVGWFVGYSLFSWVCGEDYPWFGLSRFGLPLPLEAKISSISDMAEKERFKH